MDAEPDADSAPDRQETTPVTADDQLSETGLTTGAEPGVRHSPTGPPTAPLTDPLTDPLTGPWTPDLAATDWATPTPWTPEPEVTTPPDIGWTSDFTVLAPEPSASAEPSADTGPSADTKPSIAEPSVGDEPSADTKPYGTEPSANTELSASDEPITRPLPLLAALAPLSMPEASPAVGFPVTESPLTPEPLTPEPAVGPSSLDDSDPNLTNPNPTDPKPAPEHSVDLEQVRAGVQAGLEDAEAIAAELALVADKIALSGLGVPVEWTTTLQSGDRFGAVVQMLGAMPEPAIPDDVGVIVVVGPADIVALEAARTALDLPHDGGPRPVVTIPAEVGPERLTALDLGASTRPVVVSIPVDGDADAGKVREVLQHVQAEAVIVVLDGTRSLEDNRRWVADLGQVDAVALDGALDTGEPAAVLRLGLPVVRVDGISVDRVGWAALLCTRLAVGGATS